MVTTCTSCCNIKHCFVPLRMYVLLTAVGSLTQFIYRTALNGRSLPWERSVFFVMCNVKSKC